MNPLPDMSEPAIESRLRALGQLYALGMSLRGARRIGPVAGGQADPSPRGPALRGQQERRASARNREEP